jgi:hypothetical protein
MLKQRLPTPPVYHKLSAQRFNTGKTARYLHISLITPRFANITRRDLLLFCLASFQHKKRRPKGRRFITAVNQTSGV